MFISKFQREIERMDNETSKPAEDESILYKSFSSLIIDQLNVPDVNVILDTQRQV